MNHQEQTNKICFEIALLTTEYHAHILTVMIDIYAFILSVSVIYTFNFLESTNSPFWIHREMPA